MHWESEACMRKIPELGHTDKGKKLVSDSATFSWKSPSDLEVTLVQNGSSLTVQELVYVVTLVQKPVW